MAETKGVSRPGQAPQTVSGPPQTTRSATLPGTEKPSTRGNDLGRWFARHFARARDLRQWDDDRRARLYRKRPASHIGPQGEGDELQGVQTTTGALKIMLREYLGITASEPPRVEAVKEGPGPLHERRATSVELWDNAWFQAVKGQRIRQLIHSDTHLYGRALSLVVWAPELWLGFPQQEPEDDDQEYLRRTRTFKQHSPVSIVWRHYPAPQTLFETDAWSDLGRGPVRACAWELLNLSEIAERFPKSKAAREWNRRKSTSGRGTGAGGQATTPEDDQWLYLCWANRKYLIYACAKAHLVGDVPGRQSSGPAGIIRAPEDEWEHLETIDHNLQVNPFTLHLGEVTADPELVNTYPGRFDNSIPLIDRKDDAFSQVGTLVRRYARAVPIVRWAPGATLPPGINPDNLKTWMPTWQPDREQLTLPGMDPGFWGPDVTGLDKAMQYFSAIERLIDRDAPVPSTLEGGTGASGWAEVVQTQNATRELKGRIERDKEAMEEVFTKVHLWVQHIGHEDGQYVPAAVSDEGSSGYSDDPDARTGYLRLTPAEAQDARITVRIDARLDTVDAASAQIALQILQVMSQGGADVDPAWVMSKWLHLENPEQHQHAADLWRQMHSPEVVGFVTQEGIARAKLIQQTRTQQLVEEFQQLPPEDQAKVPIALLERLAAEGALTPEMQQALLMALSGGQAPGMNGAPGGAMGPGGMNPQLSGMLGEVAPPGAPVPGAAIPGGPRQPGLGMPAAGPGGAVGQTGAAMLNPGQRPSRGVGPTPRAAQAMRQAGRPRSGAEAP